LKVLVDTSVWSLALRRSAKDLNPQQNRIREELEELIRAGRVLLIGPIRQELLSGVKDPSAFDRLQRHLRAFDDELLLTEDYEEAARISNACRTAGISGSSVDFLIAAAAVRRAIPIYTTDEDFRHYSRCCGLELYATPPG
jgi:predicted nucleic acid-binding protein